VDDHSRDALAIDPRLDHVNLYLERLAAHQASLTHVLDTHTHADHLSRVRSLARRTGAAVLAHAASKLDPVRRLQGGTTFRVGTRTVPRVRPAVAVTP
jgi:glyoxylase-like metal-dependent hydrolase (beta-lactamase superfamily II)